MSLNRTLDRLFTEIRREARRNPDFADRLDAVLQAHDSQRDVDAALIEEAKAEPEEAAAPAVAEKPKAKAAKKAEAPPAPAPSPAIATPELNPVGILQKGGEDALEEALISQGRDALLALIEEHNLDPSGETGRLDREALQAHVVAQAKKRVERDRKLFDY